MVILMILAIVALWIVRVRNVLLGDQMVWSQNLRGGHFPHYSEPLAALAWQGYVLLIHAFGIAVTDQSLAVLPILFGAAAGTVAWKISGYVVRGRGDRLLAFALICTLGTGQLYAGYIESYSILSVAVLLYLLAGLRLAHGKGSPIVPGLALALSIATHLLALFLVPSYVALIFRSQASAFRRIALLLAPVATAIGVGWLIGIDLNSIVEPFQTLGVAVGSSSRAAGGATPLHLLISRPLVDLGNLLLLVMPVPAILAVAHLASRARRNPPSPDRSFLAWAGAPGILATVVLVLPGSPAQDWDLLSVAVLPAAIWAIAEAMHSSMPRILGVGLIALALAPLLAFLLVNADEQTGARRFKTIIDPAMVLSAHERAYANEKLLKYYMARNELDSAFVYAQRAQAAEPGNGRFLIREGAILSGLGRYDAAIPYLQEGIRRVPDRHDAYFTLGSCLVRLGRFDEAVEAYREAVMRTDPRPDYLHNLGVALIRSGKADSARVVWSEVVRRWPDYGPSAQSLLVHFGGGAGPTATQSP